MDSYIQSIQISNSKNGGKSFYYLKNKLSIQVKVHYKSKNKPSIAKKKLQRKSIFDQ